MVEPLELGRFISTCRKEKNLTQKQLGEELGVILFGAAQLLAPVLSKIFVGYNTGLYAMTLHGFRVYAIAFLIIGINIFGSSFFTALNNGLISEDLCYLFSVLYL
jgi:transcriptional regulator with XRE-family HTH domain